jgi:hypothetical protein
MLAASGYSSQLYEAERRALLELYTTEAGKDSPGRHCSWDITNKGDMWSVDKCVECDDQKKCKEIQKVQKCGGGTWTGNTVHKAAKPSPRGPNYIRIGHADTMSDSKWMDIQNCTFDTCFNKTRPACVDKNKTLTVYIYPAVVSANVTNCNRPIWLRPEFDEIEAAREMYKLIRVVDTPDDACLLVVTRKSFRGPKELMSAPTWNGGRNHLLWEFHNFGTCTTRKWRHVMHPDSSVVRGLFDIGAAAVGSGAHTPASFRAGFDTSTALCPKIVLTQAQQNLGLDRKRTHLLGFIGTVYHGMPTWWNMQRIIAANYLHDPAHGIIIADKNGPCPGRADKQRYNFTEVLFGSEFGFAPGGGGPNSYRFAETLLAGSIPITTTDSVPLPFYPEIDWSKCAIRIHESRIPGLGTLLRAIQPELSERRRACAKLYDETIGADESVPFKRALTLWARRLGVGKFKV